MLFEVSEVMMATKDKTREDFLLVAGKNIENMEDEVFFLSKKDVEGGECIGAKDLLLVLDKNHIYKIGKRITV